MARRGIAGRVAGEGKAGIEARRGSVNLVRGGWGSLFLAVVDKLPAKDYVHCLGVLRPAGIELRQAVARGGCWSGRHTPRAESLTGNKKGVTQPVHQSSINNHSTTKPEVLQTQPINLSTPQRQEPTYHTVL